MNDKSKDPGELLRRLQEGLKDGGPAVDRWRLADYLSGRLEGDACRDVEDLIFTYRAWDEACADMQLSLEASDPIQQVSWDQLNAMGRESPEASQPEARRFPLGRLLTSPLFQAACLLVAVTGLTWGVYEARRNRSVSRQIALLQDQVNRARMDLAVADKDRMLAASNSPVRSYWSMTTPPRALRRPTARGGRGSSPEAAAAAEDARSILTRLADTPSVHTGAILELASVEIAAGQLDTADRVLQQAEQAGGRTAPWKTLRALWQLARSDVDSVASAEKLLQEATQEQPDYLPAWYDLALLLEQALRDAESRSVWKKYLEREQRPEYRKIAEEHLRAIGEP